MSRIVAPQYDGPQTGGRKTRIEDASQNTSKSFVQRRKRLAQQRTLLVWQPKPRAWPSMKHGFTPSSLGLQQDRNDRASDRDRLFRRNVALAVALLAVVLLVK